MRVPRRVLFGAVCGFLLPALIQALALGHAGAAPALPRAVVVSKPFGAALHLAASSDSDVSVVAACGSEYDVVDTRDGWYEVRYYGDIRWIGAARVADADAEAQPDCSGGFNFQIGSLALTNVQSGCLSLRDASSRDATILDCVQNGHEYKVQSGPIDVDGDDWIRVWSADTGSGWVLAGYLNAEFAPT